MSADAPVPTTAIAMYVAGSHFDPYSSRKSEFAGTTRSASVTPKASACAVRRAMTPRSAGRSRRRARWTSVAARRRDTSSAITPWASSGHSTSSSSSTDWSTRRTSVGSSAVTDACAAQARARRARRPWRPGRARRACGRHGARDASFDDGVEVGLDRARLHQRRPGRHALLDRRVRHRCENATGNVGEQSDAVKGGHALDETKPARRPSVSHRGET